MPIKRSQQQNFCNKIRFYWTEKDDSILKKYWSHLDNEITRQELCDTLQRSWDGIRDRARKLGLPSASYKSLVNYDILEQLEKKIKI